MDKSNLKIYNFNYKYEISTYKNIGLDYEASIDSRGIFRLIRFFRNLKNRKETSYKICKNYSEWKEHVESQLPIKIANYNDFIHWLKRKQRNAENDLEVAKIVQIPIYVSLISISSELSPIKLEGENKICFLVILLVVVIIFSVSILIFSHRKIEFYKDYIEIAEKVIENKKN